MTSILDLSRYGIPDDFLKRWDRQLGDGDGHPLTALQQAAFADEHLFDPARNLLICGATSSGKTAVAQALIAEAMARRPGTKALYLVPLRALVHEKYVSCQELLHPLRVIPLSSDHRQNDYLDARSWDVAVAIFDVVYSSIATTQWITSVLPNISMIVIDEIRVIQNGVRGERLESLLAFLLSYQRRMQQDGRPPFKIVGLAAGEDPENRLATWLDGELVPRVATERPVPMVHCWMSTAGDLEVQIPDTIAEGEHLRITNDLHDLLASVFPKPPLTERLPLPEVDQSAAPVAYSSPPIARAPPDKDQMPSPVTDALRHAERPPLGEQRARRRRSGRRRATLTPIGNVLSDADQPSSAVGDSLMPGGNTAAVEGRLSAPAAWLVQTADRSPPLAKTSPPRGKDPLGRALVARLASQGVRVLVYRASRGDAEQTASQIRKDLKNLEKSDFDGYEAEVVRLEDSPTLNDLRQTLKSRVAFHHGGLSTDERDLVERGFRDLDDQQAIRVLVATPTIAMGINTPADVVVLIDQFAFGSHIARNDDEDMQTIKQPLTNLEYQNLAGRAGRLGKEMATIPLAIVSPLWRISPKASAPSKHSMAPSNPLSPPWANRSLVSSRMCSLSPPQRLPQLRPAWRRLCASSKREPHGSPSPMAARTRHLRRPQRA